MRKILWLSLLAALCGFTSLHADLTIIQHVDGMGKNMDITALLKDGRARFDVSPGVSLIMNLKSGELFRLMRAQKTYQQVPSDGMSPGAPKDPALALAPSGKKDTISGYAADEYTCTVGGRKVTLWVTKAAPDYAGLLKEMSALYGMDMATLPGFPVRIADEVQPGQTMTTTVLSIDAKPIADSEFDIPADYKPKPMPSSIDPPPPPQ